MTTRIISSSAVICIVLVCSFQAFAQTSDRRQANSTLQAQEQPTTLAANMNSIDAMTNEIDLLRKSMQTLNTRLHDISDKLAAPDSKQGDGPNDKQKTIAANLNILTQAEQRAEVLRRQLLEAIEKEISYKSRITQMDEDMRPENIERSLNSIGTTRTVELRDARRRTLENERKGIDVLLGQVIQNRQRLEEDVRQADLLVTKLRLRLMPLIDKEIDKLNPD